MGGHVRSKLLPDIWAIATIIVLYLPDGVAFQTPILMPRALRGVANARPAIGLDQFRTLKRGSADRLQSEPAGCLNAGKAPLPQAQELGFDSSYIGADGKARGFCNWLLPDAVMVGRYPHGTPFGSKTGRPGAQESRAHIKKVLEAGITTFVCLQAEVPPQDDDSAWTGGDLVPLADEQMRAKYPQGFQRYFSDATEIAASLGCGELEFKHLPIPDFSTPGKGVLAEVLEELAGGITEQGRSVYIHCWGGRGRAGTVGACLLLKLADWGADGPDEAAAAVLATVQAGYDSRVGEDGGGSLSPETDEQRQFVLDFARAMRR